MSLKTVSTDLKIYFQTNFTALEDRVFLLTSEASYLLMSSYQTPGMSIVYKGGKSDITVKVDGSPGSVIPEPEKYIFDIFIYQSIWKEEKVIEGEGTTKGLLELRTICKGLIENINLDTDFTDDVYLVGFLDFTGTNEWPELNSDGLASWIGMSIVVKEQ